MRRSADFVFTISVAALLSFCSMGYELLIARFLAVTSSDAIFAQSLTVGTFLLALGFGAFFYGKRKSHSPWTFLVRVELAISLLASVAIPIMSYSYIYTTRPWKFIVACQIVTFVIGFLSGVELPALIEVAKAYSSRAFGWVLAANYFGALVISILLPQTLVPVFGLYMTGWLLALASAIAAGALFIRSFEYRPSLRWVGLAAALLLPPLLTTEKDAFEQFYLKSYYYVAPAQFSLEELNRTLAAHGDLPRILRYSTPYQEIDIVQDDLHLYGLGRYESEFHLMIDHKNQFGNQTESVYHDTMVHGGINLARKKPRHSLVIGGGDGLIVRDLLEYPEVESVTLVELDPKMIQLANQFPPLRALNKSALSDKRVTVVTADGFEWLRHETRNFDAIFIDLPHPHSLDLSRLYSTEFYTFAMRRLTDDGFLVFDFPFSSLMTTGGDSGGQLIGSVEEAVHEAGLRSTAAFGFKESFMIASKIERRYEFDYDSLDPLVSDISFLNMAIVDLPKRKERANSIFRPRMIRKTFGNG